MIKYNNIKNLASYLYVFDKGAFFQFNEFTYHCSQDVDNDQTDICINNEIRHWQRRHLAAFIRKCLTIQALRRTGHFSVLIY